MIPFLLIVLAARELGTFYRFTYMRLFRSMHKTHKSQPRTWHIKIFWCNRDSDAFDLRIRLPALCCTLYKAIKRNGQVTYVHWTAGIGRAPAVAVCCRNLLLSLLFFSLFIFVAHLSLWVFHERRCIGFQYQNNIF